MKRLLLAMLTLALFAASAFAQTTTGDLVGTVSGPDGVIAGATVTVIDDQTKRERTVQSSADGTFSVPQLEPGVYTVKITAPGFKTFNATQLKIDAGRPYTLNPTLEVGGVQETVTVIAGADIINSTTGELSATISPQQVKDLPINGRNPLALLNLLPGVNPTSSSINGQRSSVTNYTRDGMNVQDNFIRLGGFVQDRPTVDDTGEFTVITQNAGAEFSGSQIVQLVTPRGGDDFHGALYEFNRNSYFGANRFFNNFNNVARPFLNRNQFGGSFSGPARIPRFGEGGDRTWRNKGFFFFNYEGFRQASQAAANGTILLPQARAGNFTYTATCTASGATACPAGITPGQQLTINTLNGSGLNLAGANGTAFTSAGGALTIDPVVQSRILNNLPTAANGTTTGTNFTQVLNFNIGTPVTRNAVTGRFDLQFNDRNALNFVYKKNDESNARNDLAYGFQTSPYVFQGGPTTLYVLAYNMTPTSNLTNEIRSGYQRSEPFFFEGGVAKNFVFSTAQTQALNTLASIITNPEGSFRDQGRNTDYWNLQDNATYLWGNHSLRFGGQFQAYKIVAVNFAGTTPAYTFSTANNPNTPGLTTGMFPGGINATDLGRANNLRYLLGGIIGAGTLTANLVDQQTGYQLGAPAVRDLRFENWSGYVQDQWRVTPRLTLNLGLRYDLFTPLRNVDQVYLEARVDQGQTPMQAALNPNGVYQIVGGNAGSPGDFFKADKNNFGPSLSFAWSPTFKNNLLNSAFPGEGRTVIRGGYRISYNNNEYVRSPDNALLNHVGLGGQTINVTTNIGGTETANLRSILTPRAEAPSFQALPGSFGTPALPVLPRTYAANNTAAVANRFGSVFVIDPNLQLPLTHEYNVGIQREIGWQQAIEIRYVGSRSDELLRSIDWNQIDIRNNGFLADFVLAQRNLALNRATNPASTNFTSGVGALSVLNKLTTNPATIITNLENGTPADLAFTAIGNATTGGIPFLANPNTGVANTLENGGAFRYNSLQAEIRRRFTGGWGYQLNYTFQKILADTTQDTQTNVDPFIDNANMKLNYARPDYDRTHTINGNLNYNLPFGRDRRWLNDGPASKIFGGFQLTSIVNISSGQPLSIRDGNAGVGRGTLNRAARSSLQPATSTLTADEIKELIGVHRTPNGVFFINPSVLQATAVNTSGVRVPIDLTQPLPAGFSSLQVRGAAAINPADPRNPTPFAGQVFFRNQPGSTGNLPINVFNGPWYINWNAGLFRNFGITERMKLQLRMEVFNVLNRAQFNIGESSNIFDVNSTNFGRITATRTDDARVVQFGARFDF
ncbi:MAG TPA: TonB-dependent receptor [Pyrinomonadaceae bacterium]|nr:TonB-dependent receptor [Pyrinomonadaceae bacterium]